jgi:hypothetical protein
MVRKVKVDEAPDGTPIWVDMDKYEHEVRIGPGNMVMLWCGAMKANTFKMLFSYFRTKVVDDPVLGKRESLLVPKAEFDVVDRVLTVLWKDGWDPDGEQQAEG